MTRTLTTAGRITIAMAVLVLVAIGANPPRVNAQSKNAKEIVSKSALGVSPAIMEQALTPGKLTEFTVQVHNVTNFPLPIKSYVRDLRLQGETLSESARARLDASRWFTIEEPDFILQPKQVRTIKGMLQAPSNAAPGGHYATLFFQPLVPEEALSPSMAYVNTKVGVLVFLVVKGDIKEEATLGKPLQASSPMQQSPVSFTFSIRNSGNVHLMPTGKIKLYDWRGRLADTLNVPPGIVLPNTVKEYVMTWRPPSKLGKYRAELTIGYGGEQTQLQKTIVNFWIVPWLNTVFPVLFLSIVTIVLYKTRRRWRRAWQALKSNN